MSYRYSQQSKYNPAKDDYFNKAPMFRQYSDTGESSQQQDSYDEERTSHRKGRFQSNEQEFSSSHRKHSQSSHQHHHHHPHLSGNHPHHSSREHSRSGYSPSHTSQLATPSYGHHTHHSLHRQKHQHLGSGRSMTPVDRVKEFCRCVGKSQTCADPHCINIFVDSHDIHNEKKLKITDAREYDDEREYIDERQYTNKTKQVLPPHPHRNSPYNSSSVHTSEMEAIKRRGNSSSSRQLQLQYKNDFNQFKHTTEERESRFSAELTSEHAATVNLESKVQFLEKKYTELQQKLDGTTTKSQAVPSSNVSTTDHAKNQIQKLEETSSKNKGNGLGGYDEHAVNKGGNLFGAFFKKFTSFVKHTFKFVGDHVIKPIADHVIKPAVGVVSPAVGVVNDAVSPLNDAVSPLTEGPLGAIAKKVTPLGRFTSAVKTFTMIGDILKIKKEVLVNAHDQHEHDAIIHEETSTHIDNHHREESSSHSSGKGLYNNLHDNDEKQRGKGNGLQVYGERNEQKELVPFIAELGFLYTSFPGVNQCWNMGINYQGIKKEPKAYTQQQTCLRYNAFGSVFIMTPFIASKMKDIFNTLFYSQMIQNMGSPVPEVAKLAVAPPTVVIPPPNKVATSSSSQTSTQSNSNNSNSSNSPPAIVKPSNSVQPTLSAQERASVIQELPPKPKLSPEFEGWRDEYISKYDLTGFMLSYKSEAGESKELKVYRRVNSNECLITCQAELVDSVVWEYLGMTFILGMNNELMVTNYIPGVTDSLLEPPRLFVINPTMVNVDLTYQTVYTANTSADLYNQFNQMGLGAYECTLKISKEKTAMLNCEVSKGAYLMAYPFTYQINQCEIYQQLKAEITNSDAVFPTGGMFSWETIMQEYYANQELNQRNYRFAQGQSSDSDVIDTVATTLVTEINKQQANATLIQQFLSQKQTQKISIQRQDFIYNNLLICKGINSSKMQSLEIAYIDPYKQTRALEIVYNQYKQNLKSLTIKALLDQASSLKQTTSISSFQSSQQQTKTQTSSSSSSQFASPTTITTVTTASTTSPIAKTITQINNSAPPISQIQANQIAPVSIKPAILPPPPSAQNQVTTTATTTTTNQVGKK